MFPADKGVGDLRVLHAAGSKAIGVSHCGVSDGGEFDVEGDVGGRGQRYGIERGYKEACDLRQSVDAVLSFFER